MNNASEYYHYHIGDAIRDCEGVHNISDNIIVHGKDQAEHDERLEKLLVILLEKNLTLNLTFMGYILSERGIGPTNTKVEAVKNARRPETASEVRSFLGLVNFSVIKSQLANAESLSYFDKDAKTMIIADATPVGLGAVLIQEQDGKERVVSYPSRFLTSVERRYSQTEKEALGLVWACKRFHGFIWLFVIMCLLSLPLGHVVPATLIQPIQNAFFLMIVIKETKGHLRLHDVREQSLVFHLHKPISSLFSI
jgi:hypothetical protein